MASDEAGSILYTIDIYNSNRLTAQFTDGSVATIGSGVGSLGLGGMAYDDGNGILYWMDNNSLYTVSTAIGISTLIGSPGLPNDNFVGLAYDECNQILYANLGAAAKLYTLDVTNGAATLVGSNGVAALIDGLAWKGTCQPDEPEVIIDDSIEEVEDLVDTEILNGGQGNTLVKNLRKL